MARNGENIYRIKYGRCEGLIYYGGRKYKSVQNRTYKKVYEKMINKRFEMGMENGKDYYFNAPAKLWFDDKENTIKAGMIVSCSTKLNSHILPYFKEVFVSKLKNKPLSAFIAVKRAEIVKLFETRAFSGCRILQKKQKL